MHMANLTLNPYLFFTGDCRQAMQFYQTIFGGELFLQTMDGSEDGPIMHANLSGGAITLMASDGTRDRYDVCRITLSLNGSDEQQLRTLFDALSQGGSNLFPIKRETWGALYGSVTDKYGIDWMVNVA